MTDRATDYPSVPNGNHKPGHGGAPLGNQNAVRSGVYAWHQAGRLPKSLHRMQSQLRTLRVELERAVFVRFGRPPTAYECALISSAVRHEGRARLCERWLAVEEKLSITERLAVLQQIGSASDARDRCMKAMDLDKGTRGDVFDTIYGTEQPASAARRDADHANGQEPASDDDAPRGQHGASEGGSAA